jgi:hypothetical protein
MCLLMSCNSQQTKPEYCMPCYKLQRGFKQDTCEMKRNGIKFKNSNGYIYYSIDGKYWVKYEKR